MIVQPIDFSAFSYFLRAMEAAKLIAVFVVIIFALRRRVSVGVTLFGAGLVTAVLYRLEFYTLVDGYWQLLRSQRFISLASVIILITILGALLKELKFLDRLADACRALPGGNRTAVVLLPGLVGLMPMPGGSLLSAPLVGNVLNKDRYPAEFKTLTNYWFRHLVEFVWPIYPGLILTEAITGLPVYKVSAIQIPMTIFMISLGYFLFARKIEIEPIGESSIVRAAIGILGSIWPILLAIGLYGLVKIDIALSVLISLVVLTITAKPQKNSLVVSLKEGLSYKLVFLVFGILSFQTVLDLTGAIESIPKLATSYRLPEELLIFLVCFTVGILTGMVAAYVGLGYTLLAGFLYQPSIVPSHIFLAYLSGYVGMILSPTHLCLILTNDYFKSDLVKVYRLLAIPILLVAAFGYVVYLSPWPNLF